MFFYPFEVYTIASLQNNTEENSRTLLIIIPLRNAQYSFIFCGSRDRIIVRFTTTYVISTYHHKVVSSDPAHADVYSIQHYVLKFVNNLRRLSYYSIISVYQILLN
jgi:hypothetical protein